MWPFQKKSSAKDTDINRVLGLLWTFIGVGLMSLALPFVVRYNEAGWQAAFTVAGTGLFLAGAATLTGSVMGFLFGVPKKQPEPKEGGHITGTKSSFEKYQPNTNLEQISDWLTKIIVGVGLIEIRNVIDFFKHIGTYCGPAFGSSPSGEIIAICIAVHYLFVGFVQGFLLAYLWLPKAFNRAIKEMEDESDNPADQQKY